MVRFVSCAVAAVAFATLARAEPGVIANVAGDAGVLDLDGEGSASVHIVKVADVHVSTEAPQGCTLVASPGALQKDGATLIPVQVTTVDEGAAQPGDSAFTAPPGGQHTFSTGAPGSVVRQLYVRYTPAPLQDPGTYAASIIVTVTDN